jgi:hypothetical protein
MSPLEAIYNQRCQTPSDINEHLPTLKKYAEECEHITEMGVRWVVSTFAFMMGNPKTLISYDYNDAPGISVAYELAGMHGIDFKFERADTRNLTIEETDFLFIDTLHHYDQLKIELELHGNKAQKYIGFHDTTLFESVGEIYTNDPNAANKEEGKGLWKAIEEFLSVNPQWELHERYTNNNGLTILKRK